MKGVLILVVFSLLFTVASLLIPSPMFPGNFFCSIIGVLDEYSMVFGAIFNGVFYGCILWLIFVAFSRRLLKEE